LEKIGQLDLLERLFGSIVVPPAVVREITPLLTIPKWVSEQAPSQPIGAQILQASLGPGESEAISLALEISASWIILDDRPARRLAAGLGLVVIGTLGLLQAGKRRGFVSAIKPCIDSLVQQGFHIAPGLYKRVLTDAAESP